MLGLILGTRTGETSFEPLVLTLPLPRFLLPFPPLASFLSVSIPEGVLPFIGDMGTGDCMADADAGVLDGPSFGVFRAVMRGVCSSTTICELDKDGPCRC